MSTKGGYQNNQHKHRQNHFGLSVYLTLEKRLKHFLNSNCRRQLLLIIAVFKADQSTMEHTERWCLTPSVLKNNLYKSRDTQSYLKKVARNPIFQSRTICNKSDQARNQKQKAKWTYFLGLTAVLRIKKSNFTQFFILLDTLL